jgi:hypothetical protein
MSFNIFSKPTEAFQVEIEAPSIVRAIIFVVLAGILSAIASMILGLTAGTTGVIILGNILQWLVLSIVLWIFSVMFTPKKGKFHAIEFKEALSLTGKLWMLFVITGIVFVIGALLIETIFAPIPVILTFILGIFLIIDTYIMTKVALDIETKRAIIPWILLLIVYSLLLALVINLGAMMAVF